jgi:lipopolysaccharide/colanic/teichoic acid biosynthesis glycosyltransferase
MIVKRIIDLFLFFIAFFIALLPGLVLLVLSKWHFGRSFYLQERIGKQGKPFVIYKFTTLGPNHQLSPFWAKIRNWGLDEIPQLFNVLQGTMSWIGPRPLLPEYMGFYSDRQNSRHQVLPGIFGWSQYHQITKVLTWEERLELDAQYVEKKSILFDFQIFILSIFALLTQGRKNASDFERFSS